MAALVLSNDKPATQQMSTHEGLDVRAGSVTPRNVTQRCERPAAETEQHGQVSGTGRSAKDGRCQPVLPYRSLYLGSEHVEPVDGDGNHKCDRRDGAWPGKGREGTLWGDGGGLHLERADSYMGVDAC